MSQKRWDTRCGLIFRDFASCVMAEHTFSLELTILMPCLNEAETIGICVQKAKSFLANSRICGEVLIADNGSTDGSQSIAEQLGARVVTISSPGYGAAISGGIAAARGRFTILGDADDSYDFRQLELFVTKLRAGYELVMGNRFKGGIEPGAMPPLHRFIGNPVLSSIGRIFFRTEIGDFHCGLRGFDTQTIRDLQLRTCGMEFASEMVVRSRLAGLRVTEVPTSLKKDGRSQASHLRTWQDGWRHLRLLLMLAPRWLFLYPGLALFTLGTVFSLALLPGPIYFSPSVGLDVHTLLVASFTTLIGMQSISFAIVARRYAVARRLLPSSAIVERLLLPLTLERTLVVALILGTLGVAGMVWCVLQWADVDFGPLRYGALIKVLTVSITGVALALQLAFTAFLSALLDL
jgi:Glycosyl transferase family 2